MVTGPVAVTVIWEERVTIPDDKVRTLLAPNPPDVVTTTVGIPDI